MNREIKFKDEKLSYKIMAESDRYLICSRKLNKRQDAGLLWREVERLCYSSFTEAYECTKDLAIYTIVDLKEGIRGSDNLRFGIYDYFSEIECEQALRDLEEGKMEISHRGRATLRVDKECKK